MVYKNEWCVRVCVCVMHVNTYVFVCRCMGGVHGSVSAWVYEYMSGHIFFKTLNLELTNSASFHVRGL